MCQFSLCQSLSFTNGTAQLLYEFGKQECNIPPYFHLQTCERKQVLMQTAALAKQEASMKFDPRIIQTPR